MQKKFALQIQPVQGALYPVPPHARNMSVYLRGLAAFVPEQILDVAQVNACFQQVGGKGVTQGVYGSIRVNPRLRLGARENILYAAGAVCSAILTFKNPIYRAI